MYRYIILFLLLVSCSDPVAEPVFEIQKLGLLDENIAESSGVAFMNGNIYTHTDSRNQLDLIEIDLAGNTERTIDLPDLPQLRDWEDVEIQDDKLYIADIGNNQGRRRDLAIYTYEFDGSGVDSGILKYPFTYADQEIFDRTEYNETSHDAEALTVIGKHGYIFSKDWQTLNTSIYRLDLSVPEISQQLQPVESLNIGGLVTGATHTINGNEIILCGYSITLAPFVARVLITDTGFILKDKIMLTELLQGSSQIEGITYAGTDEDGIDTFYLTSERFEKTVMGNTIELDAALYKLQWR